MNVVTVAGLLRARADLRRHDGWTRDRLLAHQASALAELRAFAVARSPFYRELHRGLERAPLQALPIVIPRTALGKAPLIRRAPAPDVMRAN